MEETIMAGEIFTITFWLAVAARSLISLMA